MYKDIFHYGIPGMRWGIRRTEAQLSKSKKRIDRSSDTVREAKNIQDNVHKLKSSRKKQELSSMSDQELKEKVARLNLENQYRSLSSKQVSKGESYTRDILETTGTVLAIGSSALGIALAIKDLRKP